MKNYAYVRAIDLIRRIKTEETHEREIDRHKAFDLAISALEKQILKKPIKDRAKMTDFQTFIYPICHKKIVSRLDGNWIAGRPQKYCDDCGQALDFNENGVIQNDR